MRSGERRAVAILAWHKIGAPPPGGWTTWNYVPESTFMAQLGLLRDRGFTIVGLDALLQGLDQPETLPMRPAVLTFDDGYRSTRTVTAPLLAQERLPWVMFVPTDHVGGTNAFDHGAEPLESLCSWDDLRALHASGAAIASHAASHRAFSDLSADELRAELWRSRVRLERELNTIVRALAFPFGDPGHDPAATTRLLAECGYDAAFLYKGGGTVLPTASPLLLPRIAMGPDTDLAAELALVERLLP